VKSAVESTDPPRFATVTLPVEPVATTAVIWVSEFAVNWAALVLPNLTAVRLLKFVPVIVTDVPAAPDLGLKSVIVGAGVEVALEMVI
jgi:hypothetical protein